LFRLTLTLPIHTFRGHTGPVFAGVCGTKIAFSAGADTQIRGWKLPPADHDPYTNHGVAIPFELTILTGHTDAVWSLSLHPNQVNLLSASADCSIKLWDYTKSNPMLLSYSLESATPTSVVYTPSDTSRFVASFTDSRVALFDIESGKTIWVLINLSSCCTSYYAVIDYRA
jgi:striatin 1/3/4